MSIEITILNNFILKEKITYNKIINAANMKIINFIKQQVNYLLLISKIMIHNFVYVVNAVVVDIFVNSIISNLILQKILSINKISIEKQSLIHKSLNLKNMKN